MTQVRPNMGRLIRIEQRHRDARAPKLIPLQPVPTGMGIISEIGKCVGCGCRGRLLKGACEPCRNRFGQNAGSLMGKIRIDPEYARLCYLSLDAPHQKKMFIQMFGLPPGCIAS
jgi:hypothetical protein